MVLNAGAGESNDEVKQQRIAALSAWKTNKFVYKKQHRDDEGAPAERRLCLRGERTWGGTLD